MLSGKVPNYELNEYEIVAKYNDGGKANYDLPAKISDRMKNFVHILLTLNSSDRPSAGIALRYTEENLLTVPMPLSARMELLKSLGIELPNEENAACTIVEATTGQTLLHYVCQNNCLVELQDILQNYSGDLNVKDKKGMTPLHYAAEGNIACLKLLLEAAVDIECIGGWSSATPLHFAAWVNRVDYLKELISHGANIHSKNKYGATPLHNAASNGSLECLTELIAQHANINAQDDRSGWTPLHLAALHGKDDCLKALIKAGADPKLNKA